ncbi:MAG: FISUMP domain-containing protein [Flavobacteriaceae bacterium]
MKKFYVILCLAIASITQLQAQAPQGFNYQATVRNSSGDLIVNTNVYFKFNVIQGSQTAVPIFTETHYVPTDDLGQVNLVIGQGTANTGVFSELDWSLGSYYLGIELDTGSGYVAMGTTQLLSVPYALYAENSGNSTTTTPNLETVLAENNSANNQQIKDLQDPTEAQDAVTKAYVDTEVLNNVQSIEQVLTQGNDANGLQLKGIADPTEAQDAVTKAYADALSSTQGLMNFNGWDNYQVWQDNTTITLTPNSFVFINANNTTLVFPDGPENCCFGDVIYIYVMDGDAMTETEFNLEANGFPVAIGGGDEALIWSSSGTSQGSFGSAGLKMIINVGDYWMVSEFMGGGFASSNDVDNDFDGYTENQGDCDDANINIYPGATEIEDGVDNDCDGDIDEGFDVDGDGYTQNQGDCDDNNAQVNPGATEIEDGIDNDCDGEVDEGFNQSGTVTDIDGNTYDYLTYGDQVWTVENAEMVTYRDGTPIPQVTDAGEWQNLTTGAWSYYNNDPTKPRLYNWFAVMGIHDTDPNTPNKEFAPEGWHVPTDAEWTTLEEHLIANGYNYDGTTTENKIAKAMASTTGWNSSTELGVIGNDQSLNNSSGFNAFPGSYRNGSGLFGSEGGTAIFWGSTEFNSNFAWYSSLYSNFSFLGRTYNYKQNGFSVRFVRD